MAFTSLACFHGRMTSWFNSLPCVSCSPRIKPWFNSFLHSEACCLGFVFSEVLNQGLIPPHCSAAVAAAPVWRGQPWNRNLFQFSTGEVEVGSRRTGSLVRSLKGMPIWLCGKMPLGGSKPRRSWTIPYQNPQARALWPSSRHARIQSNTSVSSHLRSASAVPAGAQRWHCVSQWIDTLMRPRTCEDCRSTLPDKTVTNGKIWDGLKIWRNPK